jgi:hypothetical protein
MSKRAEHRRLSQHNIDVISAATVAARAFPVPVFQFGDVNEIGIWQRGEWVGSVVAGPEGRYRAWSCLRDGWHLKADPVSAVAFALLGRAQGTQRL